MKVRYSPRATQAFRDAPLPVQKAFAKQIGLLALDIRHPSLRAKKYDESADLWQGRVNKDWRFYFTIDRDTYVILDLVPHPK
jgi:mRNA interferase RelE/StbE